MRDCLFELVPLFSHEQISMMVSALAAYDGGSSSPEVSSLLQRLRDEEVNYEYTKPFPWSAEDLLLVAKALKASFGLSCVAKSEVTSLGFKTSSGWLPCTLASQIMQFVSADRVVLHSDFVSADKDLSFGSEKSLVLGSG